MATERHEHAAWAESQTQALVDLGVNILDATKRIDWILANLPPNENPATYIFPAHVLYQDPAGEQQDSAAAFIASDDIPNSKKRILGARAED